MKKDFDTLWNKIKSIYFKDMVLNTYDFTQLSYEDLKELVEIYRHHYNLKVKV